MCERDESRACRDRSLALLMLTAVGSPGADGAGDRRRRRPGAQSRTSRSAPPTRLTEYVGGKPRDQDVLVVFCQGGSGDAAVPQPRRAMSSRRAMPARWCCSMAASLWFYDPASKASVRISPQQRLIGQAAIGDVLTVTSRSTMPARCSATRRSRTPSISSRECWHLDLKAANDQATYNRVEYWVEHGTYYPIKAKFYSDSGRLLKILYYRGFQRAARRACGPTEAIIIDAVDTLAGHHSRVRRSALPGHSRSLVPARLPAAAEQRMMRAHVALVLLGARCSCVGGSAARR